MSANPQGRKWSITINNPREAELTHEAIIQKLSTLSSIEYMCMADEIGNETGTYHTHIYIFSSSNIRFNTLKSRFPVAHIERAYGSSKDNRDYITKTGKWKETKKAETSVKGTFIEIGEIPENEIVENNFRTSAIISKLESGESLRDIIKDDPAYAMRVNSLERLKECIDEKYLHFKRHVNVFYVYDKKGSFDYKEINRMYGYENICYICDYPKGSRLFDPYKGQNVLVFRDYTGQIPLPVFLHYLDGLPKYLPARYYNRIASYRRVYIVSSIPAHKVYISNVEELLAYIDLLIDINNGIVNYPKKETEELKKEKIIDKHNKRKRGKADGK